MTNSNLLTPVYSSDSLDTKLTEDQVIILISDLKTNATFHKIWDTTKLPEPSTFTDSQRYDMAKAIAYGYQNAQILGGQAEVDTIEELQQLLVAYVTTSMAWSKIKLVKHNTLQIFIDYDPNGTDFATRVLGTSSNDTIEDALKSTYKASAMAFMSGFLKDDGKGNATMLDITTPGTRSFYNGGTPYVNDKKVGRNAPCTCGSGKKYKKCCG